MPVSFEKIQDSMHLMNPRKGFAPEEIPIEIRTDPLTGVTGRVFDLSYRPPERPSPSDILERSGGIFCPFCPDALDKSTPPFPQGLIPNGRINIGQAKLIPNILPLDRYVGVSILSHDHYTAIEDLKPLFMKDGFLAALTFIKRVADYDSGTNFFSINWNYMPQAGSSLVHPHLQVLCGAQPTNHLRLQLEGAERYFKESGRSFWGDLIIAEKDQKERYLGEIGSTVWVMSFVPRSYLPDVWCIFPGHASLLKVEEGVLDCFLEGLSRVLTFFHEENIFSFNLSIFSVREHDRFRVNAAILPRLFLRDIGNSDHTFLQAVHKETYSVRRPESVCQAMKNRFPDTWRDA